MAKTQLHDVVRKLLQHQRFAVIASASQHQPYTNLVSFAASADLRHLYFPTKKDTQKFLNITENNKVAMLIDDRENAPSDVVNATTITALGTARELRTTKEAITHLLLQKHPELFDFLHDPSCALIEVDVLTYQIVQRFEHVRLLHMRDGV